MPGKCHFEIKSFQKKPEVILPPRLHGLFGMSFKDHMMMDPRWTPNDLMTQYSEMTKALHRFKKTIDSNKTHCTKGTEKYLKKLRHECRDGRIILKQRSNVNGNSIGQVFIERKELKRRYSNTPLDQINYNLDQKTFCLRKEYDRLKHRASKLKVELQDLLMQRAKVENLINVQEQLRIPEFDKMAVILKELEKNKICYLVSVEINCAYKKIIRTLNNEALFYGVILDSLHKDVLDQDRFIEHILDVGKPAISRFAELSTEFNKLRENYQKFVQQSWKQMYKTEKIVQAPVRFSEGLDAESIRGRYDRKSMAFKELESQLQALEVVIKDLKMATYCGNTLDIYPCIKDQKNLNESFMKQVECMNLQGDVLHLKRKLAKVFKGVLNYNLSPFETKRNSIINEIQEKIRAEDNMQAKLLHQIKVKTYKFVIIRYFLWQMYDILKCVQSGVLFHSSTVKPKTAYFSLPLLHFDGMNLYNTQPPLVEENLEVLTRIVISKLQKLTSAYNERKGNTDTMLSVNSAREHFLNFVSGEKDDDERFSRKPSNKTNEADQNIGYHFEEVVDNIEAPYRKQIKAASYKLVEENSKKET